MERKSSGEIEKIVAPILLEGGVGVFPTDTLYGLVGSALKVETVERIYGIRKRELTKPMIILISSIDELKLFGVSVSEAQKKSLKKLWPGKISIVLPCDNKKMSHLLRGGKTLAFRLPDEKDLSGLLKKVGPLVAPSANLAGEKPAQTYAQARRYFSEKIDFYVDAGKLSSEPSTLIELKENGKIKILREGAVKVD